MQHVAHLRSDGFHVGCAGCQLRLVGLTVLLGIAQAVLDDARKRELQTVIQAHFKEWLHSSGNLRQVYDLARMEREDVPFHPS